MSWQLRITNKLGKRISLDQQTVTSLTYAIEQQGGFADFSMGMFGDDIADCNLEIDDRIELFNVDSSPSILKYRGYVTEINPTEEDATVFDIIGYGRMVTLEKIILDGFYQYATDVDLSIVVADIMSEVKKRYQDINLSIDIVGVSLDSYDARGKTAAAALSDLLAFGAGTLRYGFDVDESGVDRLYLRLLVDDSVASPDHTVGIQEPIVTSAGLRRSTSDLYNVVIVEGSTPRYPQLLPNGSFEVLRRSEENDGNIIENPSFEADSSWTFSSGSTRKIAAQEGTTARTGNAAAEIDGLGESVSQTELSPVIAIRPTKDYGLSFYACPESEYDPEDPPLLLTKIQWLDAVGTVLWEDEEGNFIRERIWKLYDLTSRPPIGTVGYKVIFQLDGASPSGTNQGVWIDDVNLSDATTMYPVGWGVDARGTSQVTAINWMARDAYHGRNCLAIFVTSSDDADNHVVVEPTPEYLIDVIPGQHLEFSLYMKSYFLDSPIPKTTMRIVWRDEDNLETGTPVDAIATTGTILNDWTLQNIDGIAPVDAIKAVVEFNIKGNGGVKVDCMSFRHHVESSPIYLEEGNLRIRLRADEVITEIEDADAHNSIAIWGQRDAIISTEATTIEEATKVGKAALLANSKYVPEPTLSFKDDIRYWWTDQRVKFVGFRSSFWQNGLMPVVRIAGSIEDDSLVESVTFLRIRQTTEDILRRILNGKDKDKSSIGGSAGITSSNYSGGGGSGAPGSSATINIGTVITVDPDEPADVRNIGTNFAAVLDFDIPQGIQGEPGEPGEPGESGSVIIQDNGTPVTTRAALNFINAIIDDNEIEDSTDVTLPEFTIGEQVLVENTDTLIFNTIDRYEHIWWVQDPAGSLTLALPTPTIPKLCCIENYHPTDIPLTITADANISIVLPNRIDKAFFAYTPTYGWRLQSVYISSSIGTTGYSGDVIITDSGTLTFVNGLLTAFEPEI